jgi:hypothetical protein
MGSQSAARIEGDRYQHLYSWYLVLLLLGQDSEYEYAFVEHPSAGSADDVTLHPKAGSTATARFYQVKWHVTSGGGQYTYESLAKRTKKEKTSLIEKLFKSWKKLSADGPAEVWLISNWSAAKDFGKFIHGRDYRFEDVFLTCGDTSAGGRGRKVLKTATGAAPDEFNAFCRDLRFRLGFAGITDLEEFVDDRMGRRGLKTGRGPRAIAIDEIKRLIEEGGGKKKITRESLIDLIREHDLFAPMDDQPKVSLYIHGWAKRAFDSEPTVELDWTRYFDREYRLIPSQDIWDKKLFPELRTASNKLRQTSGGNYIDFRGKLPLSAILAVGAALPEVAGITFRAEQPTAGENFLWRSDAPSSTLKFRELPQGANTDGEDILLAFAITGDGRTEIERFYNNNRDRFSSLVYFEPETGAGPASIKNASDAVALANAGKDLIRHYRNFYASRTIHIILYAPASFCLFLGQKLNALGQIITYERTTDGDYQESVILRTG